MAASFPLLSVLITFITTYLATSASPAAAVAAQYSVTSYGARPDGRTDSTRAFLAAWNKACSSPSPATIYVPAGTFYLKNVAFQGPCKSTSIAFLVDGTLLAPSDYGVIGPVGNWIMFHAVDGVTVSGGTLDGQGKGLWACKASGKSCPQGATTLEFSNSKNIQINGVASLNSQLFHIVINGCQNVKVQGVRVTAAGDSPNTDGIHVQESNGMTILNSRIGTGDDCISIGPGATNLWIEGVSCGPGHGISIGSLGKEFHEAGVQNVTVRTVTFTGTENGVRIKSWGRPSTGFARNVLFQHAVMNNVQNPIVIDQNYCPGEKNCPGQDSGVKVSDVTYQDIHGSSQTEVAVKFTCSKASPCTGIRMEDVKLSYKNKVAGSSCQNADGTASGVVQPGSCL
ncbi:unnamed protein product [Linum tenue]|uniref:Polygalacturonase n=1 Tax=Linum tenue TaxID=586396 RepID=A0AAV0PJS6_9ROSI|nr:unnamed protein product [Linum tenue]